MTKTQNAENAGIKLEKKHQNLRCLQCKTLLLIPNSKTIISTIVFCNLEF